MARPILAIACLVLLSGCRLPWELIDATEPPPPTPSDPSVLPAGGADTGGGFGNLDPGITGSGSGGAVEAPAPASRPRPIQLAQAHTTGQGDDLPTGLDDIPAGAPLGDDQLGDMDIDLDEADYRAPLPPPRPRGGRDRYREPAYDRGGRRDDYRPDRRRRGRDSGYQEDDRRRGRDRNGVRHRDRGGEVHASGRRDRGDRDSRRGRRGRDDTDDRRGRRGRRDHDHYPMG